MLPERVEHVLPAGPPAAVLLAASRRARCSGFAGPISDGQAALAPSGARLPAVPRLTGPRIRRRRSRRLHPDLIIDYGTVSPRYKQLAQDTQQKTGIPTLLFDGALDQIPSVARTLGRILHQPGQGRSGRRASPRRSWRCRCRRATPQRILRPRRRWSAGHRAQHRRDRCLRPPGLAGRRTGRLRHVPPERRIEAIRTLDPDIIILSDPAAKDVLAKRAVGRPAGRA